MSQGRVQRGFTLIEVMMAVAIIAILAAIAYPSYTSHMLKSRRSEAQQALMEVASRQQQFLLDTRSYATLSTLTSSTVGMVINSSVTKYYTITVDNTASAFTATAAPLGSQAADTCGSLILTNTGAKSPITCW